MRSAMTRITWIAAGLISVCGCKSRSDAAHAKAAASASASGVVNAKAGLRARIGGQLVTVGDHHVELRLLKRGLVEAVVYDARGQLIAAPDKAQLTVHAKTEAGARAAIACAWDPAAARFSGHTQAGAELAPAPVDVELELGGASAKGTLETPVLLVGPVRGGALFAAGKYGVELLADPRGRVEAVIHDAAGALVDGKANAKFEVELSAADGKLHAVSLAWNAARARFVGHLDAGARLAAGPAELEVDGKVAARLPALALRVKATHNGRVVLVGDYSVELVEKGNLVSAYAFDASGDAHAKGDLDLALRIGDGAFVKLAWDAPSLSYQGKVGAALDLDAKPVVVAIKADGKAFVGAYARADALLDAKAKLRARAGAAANARAKANVRAKLKAPGVHFTPPKVSVKAEKHAGASAKAGFSFGMK